MTDSQVKYWTLVESKRHNTIQEKIGAWSAANQEKSVETDYQKYLITKRQEPYQTFALFAKGVKDAASATTEILGTGLQVADAVGSLLLFG